jgi:hypothetical protein
MADRPIIFSAPMIRALLAGRKTQTRRILKPQPRPFECEGRSYWSAVPGIGGRIFVSDADLLAAHRWCVGDRLWVKETWQTGSGFDGPQIAFRATGDCHDIEAWDGEDEGAGPSFNYERCPGAKWHTWLPDLLSGAAGIWRPSLFMPRWASRLTLLVTNVRGERLQDISEADAVAEGIEPEAKPIEGTTYFRNYEAARGDHLPARASFASLWSSINGPESWQANPWVVAVTFSVHARNIDQLAPIAEAAE